MPFDSTHYTRKWTLFLYARTALAALGSSHRFMPHTSLPYTILVVASLGRLKLLHAVRFEPWALTMLCSIHLRLVGKVKQEYVQANK
jgi:hypothetical protein